MRHTIGRGFRYVRVPHQRVIDLDRSDFLGAAIDHLPLASMQREEPLLIEAAYIACSIPAVDERGPIELRRIEITRHHVAPNHQNFSLLAWWYLLSIISNDLDTVRPWNAACPGLVRPRGRHVRGNLSGLAGPVMLQHRNAEDALQTFPHLLGNAGAGGRDKAQAMLSPPIGAQLGFLDDGQMQ